MNKPVHLDLLILEIRKIVMHEFWYDYAKPKQREKANISYIDLDCFIVSIKKKEDIDSDIAKNAENRFDTSN